MKTAKTDPARHRLVAPRARRPVAARALARARAAAYDARADLAIVTALAIVAGALRLWHLGSVPLGLHGDEAWTGIDARRVLHEGWIGPYVISALGQPTGPLYFTALLFKLLPDTTFTLRMSMALLGVATIPLAYLAFSAMFGRTVGVFSAIILCFMTWHLQLTRTAFMVSAWPFMEMLVLWTLFAGLHRRSFPLLALAGIFSGFGVYSYNAYPLFLPVVGVAAVWTLVHQRSRRDRVLLVAGIGAIVSGALLVSLPMLAYIDAHGDTYRVHQEVVNVTYTAEWKDAGIGGKANILRHRFDEWAQGLVEGNRPDFGDGLAARWHPVVNPVIALFALAGLAMAVWRWKSTAHATILAATAILPFGALLTVGDGLFRRSFGLAPFVAVLAALPIAWLWDRARARDSRRSEVLCTALAALVASVAVFNVTMYFGPNQDTEVMRYTYPYQDDAAAHYIADLPARTFVYFYSDGWSLNYETRRFIAPRAIGVDRSREFGGVRSDGQLDFGADRTRDVAFIFLGAYLDQAPEVQGRYPGGELSEGYRGSELVYRAYYLPAAR